MLLPLLSAILGILAFLPFNLYPAGFVFLVPLFIFFVKEKKFWRLVLGVFIFKLVFSLGTTYYTLEPINWAWTIFIFSLISVFVWLLKKFLDHFFHKPSTSLLIFLLPFIWTFFDLLQAKYSLLTNYISAAGNSLSSSPFLGLAIFGGITALTFFAAAINALIAAIVLKIYTSFKSLPDSDAKSKIHLFLVQNRSRRDIFYPLLVIFALIFLAGQISNFELKKNSSNYSKLPNSIKFTAISANEKFNIEQFFALRKELSDKKSDLIIFPENIFDRHVSFDTPANIPFFNDYSASIFQNLAKDLDTNILAAYGTFQRDKKYNSTILLDSQGNIAGIHSKNRLTFIGEYWPFDNWHPSLYDWLRKKDPSIKTFAIFDKRNVYSKGEQNLLTTTFQKNSVSFAAPICGEFLYTNDLKKYKANGAKFIVNQTSNRWLDIGVNHFIYLTENMKKIEAVRLAVPIISSGVQGSAGIILPNGQEKVASFENKYKNFTIFSGEIRY